MNRLTLAALSLLPAVAGADPGVLATKHNLSVTGTGTVKSDSETQICIFCHVPHRGGALGDNRPPTTATYTPYSSTTLVSPQPGQPSGATRMCLSCHDGTIAVGETLNGSYSLAGLTGGRLGASPSNLGTDLRTTHPVSFAPGFGPDLHNPPPGDVVTLDVQGRVQCTSCHDPHIDGRDALEKMFLVEDNRGSPLCTTCHTMRWWLSNPSIHQASTKTFDRTLGAHTNYATVGDNGCQSCHQSHGGATQSRLLDTPGSQLCLKCHTGRVAAKDISADLVKTYAHPAGQPPSPAGHDASEGPASPAFVLPETSAAQVRHGECVDCHNPHAAFAQTAAPPFAGGALAGVWGIDKNGARVEPVQFSYEVCFKCHADSVNQPQRLGPTPPETVRRAVIDPNLRRRFDAGAASSHPIEGPGSNPLVPGLIAPYTAASVIACTDCHASDGGPGANGLGAAGPHGSIWPHILERGFATADRTVESASSYALCYKCHDRDTLLSAGSTFTRHRTHVVNDQAPCSTCHDWHGVSALQGNAVNNAHLIDFDVSIVAPARSGVLQYVAQGPGHGSCTLNCHGKEHVDLAY